jgi:hypothetical protein
VSLQHLKCRAIYIYFFSYLAKPLHPRGLPERDSEIADFDNGSISILGFQKENLLYIHMYLPLASIYLTTVIQKPKLACQNLVIKLQRRVLQDRAAAGYVSTYETMSSAIDRL